jgi:hypothetical protein
VRVNFVSLLNKIRPKDHINVLRRVCLHAIRHCRIQGTEFNLYLTEVPTPLAELLIGLIGSEATLINEHATESRLQTPMQVENINLEMWEHHIESEIESDGQLLETERKAMRASLKGREELVTRVQPRWLCSPRRKRSTSSTSWFHALNAHSSTTLERMDSRSWSGSREVRFHR